MSRITYAISAILALAGTGSSVFGIAQGEFKPIGIGLVLICGATVFAVLYLGTRSKQPQQSERSNVSN